MKATVKWFKNSYGFATPDDGSKDVFVHISAVQKSRLDTLTADDRIEFDVEIGKNGREQACNVQLLRS